MRSICLISICAALALSSSARAEATDEADVAKTAQAIIDAFNAVNIPAFSRLIATDYVTVDEFAPFLFTGPAALRSWGVGALAYAKRAGRTETRCKMAAPLQNQVDGDRAYYVAPIECVTNVNGTPQHQSGVQTFVLSRQADGWRANFISYSGEPPHSAAPR